MKTFDDLLNEEILNEFGSGGLRDAVATKISRSVASAPDNLKAKMGSKAAQGRNNLRDMVAHLEDEFKVYCGEQSLRPQNSSVEDFLEFLRHRVGFNISDQNFDRLAYGPTQDAPEANKINELEQLAQQAIEQSQSPDPHILELAGYAAKNDGNGVMARKALWKLARANPSRAKDFAKVQRYIGRPLAPMFKRLSQQVAQLIIKIGDKGGVATSKDGEEKKDSDDDAPMNLDIGIKEVPNPFQLRNHKWDYAPLFDDLEHYGLSQALAHKIGVGLADEEPDDEAETDGYKDKLHRIKRENGINIVRLLMQASRGNNRDLLRKYLVKKHPEFKNVVENDLHGRGTRVVDPNDPKAVTYEYDATDLNNKLARLIPNKNIAQGVIVIMLGCLGKELK